MQPTDGAADRFRENFAALTGHTPFRWQQRLYLEHFLKGNIPAALDLPTGLGKTSVIAIWYLALKAGASLPRRLVYVVDRRAVVDQATTVADEIKRKSNDAALRVSTLRGQHVDNKEWLEDPAAPAIIVGTVDMIGSRLLFSGYGVTRGMRPYHAGLLGADTLVVLDEAHLVPPFERLLERIQNDAKEFGPRDPAAREIVPPFRLMSLSATGRADAGNDGRTVFRLVPEDYADEEVEKRLKARKRLRLEATGDAKALASSLAEHAWQLSGKGAKAIRCIVYCDKRDVAEKTKTELDRRAKGKAHVELFVGARRVKEREDAKKRLEELGFLAGSEVELDKPAFLVATSAGEVGVDLDADHMVCDLVPIDRMIQRLGRVNRRGGAGREARIIVLAVPPTPARSGAADEATDEVDLEAKQKWREAIEALPPDKEEWRDASPEALTRLKASNPSLIDAASTPEPLRPALSRALVDAWSMTSLAQHTGRPEVGPWLRGWVDDKPQTVVVWRKYLPVRVNGDDASPREIERFFEAAVPHLSEKLETETWHVAEWLIARATALLGATQGIRRQANLPAPAGEACPLGGDDVAAITLGRDGQFQKTYRLKDLLPPGARGPFRKTLERDLADVALIVDARIAGLRDGLLNAEEDDPPPVADAGEGWLIGENGEPVAGFRVRPARADEEPAETADWHPTFLFAVERDEEGEPVRQLVVEKWKGAVTGEEERSISNAQSLAEHQCWTAEQAAALARTLGLRGDLARALEIAARLHDEGKRASRWQRAFNAPDDGVIYAKTRGPFNPHVLGHYRHEFGSLRYAEEDAQFRELDSELQELVLHLIAAHHGRARPIIETDGCEDAPSSVLKARARDVTLRFARLQERWGPWGLAWLEALLRAADQKVSRLNDARQHNERRQPHKTEEIV